MSENEVSKIQAFLDKGPQAKAPKSAHSSKAMDDALGISERLISIQKANEEQILFEEQQKSNQDK